MTELEQKPKPRWIGHASRILSILLSGVFVWAVAWGVVTLMDRMGWSFAKSSGGGGTVTVKAVSKEEFIIDLQRELSETKASLRFARDEAEQCVKRAQVARDVDAGRAWPLSPPGSAPLVVNTKGAVRAYCINVPLPTYSPGPRGVTIRYPVTVCDWDGKCTTEQ